MTLYDNTLIGSNEDAVAEILDSTMAVQGWKDLVSSTGIYIHIVLKWNSLIRPSVVLGGWRKHLENYCVNSPLFSSVTVVTNSSPHNFTNVLFLRGLEL